MEGLLGEIRAARNPYEFSFILPAATASLRRIPSTPSPRHITPIASLTHITFTPSLHPIPSKLHHIHSITTPHHIQQPILSQPLHTIKSHHISPPITITLPHHPEHPTLSALRHTIPTSHHIPHPATPFRVILYHHAHHPTGPHCYLRKGNRILHFTPLHV